MTEFLKNFESAKEKAQGGHARTREVIVELLKHIANSIAHTERLGENAPSRKDAQQAQKEHDFKNSALQAAKDTHERLQAELRKRRGELDKINGAFLQKAFLGAQLFQRLHVRVCAIRVCMRMGWFSFFFTTDPTRRLLLF